MTGRTRKRVIAVAVASAVTLGALVVLYSVLSPYPDVARAPQEQDRVVHPAGFSIIKPGRTKVLVQPDAMVILPDGGRARYGPSLRVEKLSRPPDLAAHSGQAALHPGRFQDREAWIYVGPAGEYSAWCAFFARGSDWFEIDLFLDQAAAEPMPPPQWLAYLNTFSPGR